MKDANIIPIVTQLKSAWTKIYQDWFNKEVDFTNLTIPAFYNPAKHFAVIVAQGTTLNQTIVSLRQKFDVFLYTEDLDMLVNTNNRIADKDYVVIFNKNIEADDDLKNLSANELAKINIFGITLLERLLLEIFYFNQTQEHLDINNWTLCSGSHDSNGVLCVHWHPDGFGLTIAWFSINYRNNTLRGRVVVTQ